MKTRKDKFAKGKETALKIFEKYSDELEFLSRYSLLDIQEMFVNKLISRSCVKKV